MENKETYLKLDQFREMKILCDGKVLVVKPIEHSFITPLFCPVCLFSMKTSDDSAAYKKYKCCDLCSLKFAIPNKEKWLEEEWRPSKEQLNEHIQQIEIIKKPLFNLR